jgi:hypothetical protein
VKRFKREIAHTSLLSYLVPADEPISDPLLSQARLFFYAGIQTRKPYCCSCKRSFLGEARPGAFLFGVPVDATAASVSAFCQACFSSLSDSDLEREALRVHRLVLPNARFEHDRPADPRSSRRSHNTG